MNFRSHFATLCALVIAVGAGAAHAEKADKDKPTHIEANRMSSDDTRRMSIFEGNVVLTKGTLTVHANRIVVREDLEGFQIATATGNPATFRQKTDPKGDQPAVWIDGEAKRIVLDDKDEKVELFDNARVTRDKDEVRGNYIFVDERSDFYSVTGGTGAQPGRVRAVLQPKNPPATTKPAPGKR